MKKVCWEGTSHWDELLIERAQMSGELALSPDTKQALEKFKNK
jgi:methylglutaconyl-CoA hydratase